MRLAGHQTDMLLAAGTSAVFFFISAWIFVSIVRRRMAERHELRRTILEKLSSEELVRLLESDGGRGWLRDVLVGPDNERTGFDRGLMLLFGSIGCGVAAALAEQKILGVIATIGFALGVGQIVATIFFSRRARGQ